ncbi:hypothetical protein HanHA300_Chr15g0552761 [Helianthus annuus]|nr:hypothetical protein HanHA300_Chr15g0552761 [Helianthus annuus]
MAMQFPKLTQAKVETFYIEHGFHQVVAHLLHSTEFKEPLGQVDSKLLYHGRHVGLIAGTKTVSR